MKKIKLIAIIILALTFITLPLVSCDKKEPVDETQEKLTKYFTEVYKAFNDCKFDKYIEYLDMEETVKSEIKERLESVSKMYTSKYEIERLAYDDNGDGTYNVKIQSIVNITDLNTNTASKIREVNLYFLTQSGDSYKITKIVEGESELVTD